MKRLRKRKLTAEDVRELSKKGGPNPEAIGFLRGILNTATPEALKTNDDGARAIRGMLGLAFGMILPETGIEVDGPLGDKIRVTRADGQAVASQAISELAEVYGEQWAKANLHKEPAPQRCLCPPTPFASWAVDGICPKCKLPRKDP